MSKVDFFAQVLYEVIERRVSLDVAFKRACKKRCARTLDERERLYQECRRLVSNYVKLKCLSTKKRSSYRDLARAWVSGRVYEPVEPHCRLSVSKWLYEKIANLLGPGGAEAMLKAFEERTWWLRLNTLKAPEERVLKELEAEGVELEVHPEIPYMVRVLSSPKPIRLLKPVREFKALPQDLASAVSVEFIDVRPGDVVVDMCAAPGLKTSLIVMLEESARVLAFDISNKRLRIMRHLLKKLGVPESRVQIALADSRFINLVRPVDKVLLDAPCSNSGSIDKDPSIKATLTQGKVEFYSKRQLELLLKSLELSDCVVYTTCSILPDEGEDVIEKIVKKTSVKPVVPPRFRGFCSPGYSGYEFSSNVCRLYPHVHKSEGFFISRLERL
ncbi:MAG: RsmB/NOP family class I SAM-dependent RNA methyltransferase [Sulfolobales archaeon]